MKFKQLYDTKLKKAILIPVAAATIIGTYSGTEGGFTPIWNIKNRTSYGINVGLFNEYFNSTFNGITFGLFNKNNKEGINSKMNGLEISLLNTSFTREDIPTEVNGLQIGIINYAEAGNVVQIGVYNEILKENGKRKRTLGLNFHFKGKGKK